MENDVYVYLADILLKRDPLFAHYADYRGQVLVKLKKAQYRCVESAKFWFNTMSAKMVSLGYDINPYNRCVFMK